MEAAKLVLEYLKIFLSPQVISGAIVMYVLMKHGSAIGKYVATRLTKWNLGGFSAEAAPQPQVLSAGAETEALAVTAVDAVAVVDASVAVAAAAADANAAPAPRAEAVQPDPREELARLDHANSVLRMEIHFERILNVIFATQLSLLKHLASAGDRGETWRNVFAQFYKEYAKKSSKPAEFEEYLRFLTVHGLVNFNEGTEAGNPILQLSPLGVTFVSYFTARYPKGVTRLF